MVSRTLLVSFNETQKPLPISGGGCYDMGMYKTKSGFTIVELLIVIVVIAILAAISIVAYNGIQARGQDAKRAQDMANIEKALRSYEVIHGGVPVTWAYGGNGVGDWNNSKMTNWLTFLEGDFGKMPRDSVNKIDNTNGSGELSVTSR